MIMCRDRCAQHLARLQRRCGQQTVVVRMEKRDDRTQIPAYCGNLNLVGVLVSLKSCFPGIFRDILSRQWPGFYAEASTASVFSSRVASFTPSVTSSTALVSPSALGVAEPEVSPASSASRRSISFLAFSMFCERDC